MNILQIVQEALSQFGLPKPATLIGNTDQTATQAYTLLKKEIRKLSRRTQWQQLAAETTFTTVAQESQGVVSTLLPNLDYIINNTIWNRSLKVPVYGSLSPEVYAQKKSMVNQAPYNQFRIMGDNFLMYPAPSAGQTIAVDYMTNFVGVNVGGTQLTEFTADTDSPILDSDAIIAGVIWRFKKEKGFDYSEDYNDYSAIVDDLMARNVPPPILQIGGNNDFVGGIFIPAGSW